MKEKVLIEGKLSYQAKNFRAKSTKIGVLLTIGVTILILFWDIFQLVSYSSGEALLIELRDDFISYYWPVWFIWVPFLIIGFIGECFLPKIIYTITVTNKKVRGVSSFGSAQEVIDLPIDSITSVAATILKGITITTASGSIRFLGLNNRDEVYEVINNLINERSEKKTSTSKNVKDELKELKELLDEGIITQEEFDKKKKELLNL